MIQRPKTLIILCITSAIILLAYPLVNNAIIFNSVFGLDSGNKSSSVQNNKGSQIEQEKHQQQAYNANVLTSTIKSTQSIFGKGSKWHKYE